MIFWFVLIFFLGMGSFVYCRFFFGFGRFVVDGRVVEEG